MKTVGKFLRNGLGVIGAVIILGLIFVAIFAPLIAPFDPNAQDYNKILISPDGEHLFGTDDLGRDIFSRVVYGARISIQAALISVGIAMLIGVPIGLLSGYYRGFWDEWIVMRSVDAMQAFPFLILALAISAVLGSGFGNAMLAIGIGFAPAFIRITRGQVLSLRNMEYIQAARSVGVKDARIIFRHILPNAMNPIVIQATLAMASGIIAEASLSYLGLGVQPPTPSWGSMLNQAQTLMSVAPYATFYPGIAIFLVVLGFNLLGDGLQQVLDPRARK
ncbi:MULTISPECIES: ABC transporter permease [Brevibacillus]|uniref:ABC transporter permease n=1 Tax=Brevibacillus porteri TaxID=2126350 RepID=A0ABX5FQI6_9BACL|nr:MULTISPECIES: ABC transporter permease [Brevibacillus]MDC0761283.1 ABC transporter permease [Brevibacillus sp. AG]MED1800476.1 ABC transporter permease [Brevibacillus porteri]MED2132659.1 ABC transporter permease [Brevibacillus porteri]MED2743332.1 ABC transporter permease [Brevibacillus porteri]MED2816142.1 ABC transporter permease [Brevibacillus porteri]